MSKIDKIIKEQNCSLMCDTVRQIANERNRFEARVKELEEKLNAQFAEMEEKLTTEEMKNFELKEKLKIKQSAINLIESYLNRQCKKCKSECYVTHCDICEARMLINLIEICNPTKDERGRKMTTYINGEEIELPSFNDNDLKVEYPTLDDYADFIMTLNNGEKFNVKILKSDFERIKDILEGKGGSDEN